jgi:type IV pilus assembly protein PilE
MSHTYRDELPEVTAPRRAAGFTLIELMIALAVAAILAAIAGPAFFDQMRKSRRAEAITALAQLQQAQERWRSTNAEYAPAAQLSTGLGVPATTTPGGYYTIAITAADATSYVATATAVSGKSQASDSGCTVMAVRMQGGNVGYGSGSGPDWTDPKKCWAR